MIWNIYQLSKFDCSVYKKLLRMVCKGTWASQIRLECVSSTCIAKEIENCDFQKAFLWDRQLLNKMIQSCHMNEMMIRDVQSSINPTPVQLFWDLFVKHGCPAATKPKSLCFTNWPHPLKGMWCQWNVSNPWMNLQSKLDYCTTIKTVNIDFICRWDKTSDRPRDGKTDGRFNN